MTIRKPETGHIPGIRQLWEDVFQEEADFLDRFFSLAFAPDRCRIALEGEQVIGMVHWLTCSCRNRELAYLYAVAVAPQFRDRGIGSRLLLAAEDAIREAGFAGILLVPQEEDLRAYYAARGYENVPGISEMVAAMGDIPAPLHCVNGEDYALHRREFLPEGGVIQEGETLALLSGEARFDEGLHLLLAARVAPDGSLFGLELLGDPANAPGILPSLGIPRGRFRIPGSRLSFAMYKPLIQDAPAPTHFAFALD